MSYQHIEVIQHSDPDIFEVVFANNSREAVDEYVDAILNFAESVRKSDKMNHPIWLLIDVTQSGMYSIPYGRAKIGELVKQVGDVPKAYFAYLVKDASDRYIVENYKHVGNPRQQGIRKAFSGVERDKATAWLISQTEI